MMTKWKRRLWLRLATTSLAAVAVAQPAAAQPAAATDDFATAKAAQVSNRAALEKITLAMAVEPAFAFQA